MSHFFFNFKSDNAENLGRTVTEPLTITVSWRGQDLSPNPIPRLYMDSWSPLIYNNVLSTSFGKRWKRKLEFTNFPYVLLDFVWIFEKFEKFQSPSFWLYFRTSSCNLISDLREHSQSQCAGFVLMFNTFFTYRFLYTLCRCFWFPRPVSGYPITQSLNPKPFSQCKSRRIPAPIHLPFEDPPVLDKLEK